MPIVSNRGSVGTTRVSANENYTDRDYGRILYESALNDDIVFKAAIARDFKEVSARNEGTMLESELSVFSEFSAKEAWRSLKEKLKKIWEKLKAIFKSAFAKITTWIVRDGKAFVKLHRARILANKDIDKCEIPNVRTPKSFNAKLKKLTASINNCGKVDPATSVEAISKYPDIVRDNGRISAEKICNQFLSKSIDSSDEVTVSNFKEKAMDTFYNEEQSEIEYGKIKSALPLKDLFSTLEGGKEHLKELKKANTKADKVMASNIKAVDKAERAHAKTKASEENYNSAKDATATDYADAAAVLSGSSSALTAISKAVIDVVRFDIKQARMIVGKLAGFTYHEGALLEQMAWLEGADEFDAIDDMDEDEIVDGADIESDADVDDLGDDED